MAIIKCNNPSFNDFRFNVQFKNGVGKTTDPVAIEWFKANGYKVISETKKNA